MAALLASIVLGALGLWAAHAGALLWSEASLVALTLLCVTLAVACTRATAAAVERERWERSHAELSELATHLLRITERDKFELARNLHDELGGLLTAAKMDLSWLQARATESAPVQQRLQQLGTVLDEAMDVKRRIVEELRPSLLEHFGLPTTLRSYLETTCRQAGLDCHFAVEGEEPLPKEHAIALFRIVEEALDNVVRHAGARGVRVTLACEAKRSLLELADDGVGMDLSGGFRWPHGLAGMRQRVRALGGELAIESAPGRGLALHIELPAGEGLSG
jgi:signal transduction histidine kinase